MQDTCTLHRKPALKLDSKAASPTVKLCLFQLGSSWWLVTIRPRIVVQQALCSPFLHRIVVFGLQVHRSQLVVYLVGPVLA